MSENSELLWVAIPGGVDRQSGEGILRVVMIPRLSGSLREEGMEHFPPESLVRGTLGIDLRAAGEVEFRTLMVNPPHIQAQPQLWEAIFGPETTVAPAGRRAGASSVVQVEDRARQAEAVKSTFATVAKARVTEESADELHKAARDELATSWSGEARRRRPPAPQATGRAAEPIDFHGTLALLREHPAVVRALGLIVDLRIRREDMSGVTNEGLVRVRWLSPAPPPELPPVVSPWTRFEGGFFPASTAIISRGMVTLTDDRVPGETPDETVRWEVVTVDIDGASARLMGAAQGMARANASPAADAPDGPTVRETRATLPALRTAGLVLVRRGRQQDFEKRRVVAETNARLNSMNEAELDADSLVLGYRLDVFSQSAGDWFSLHQREARYSLNGNIQISSPPIEEGHLKAHAAIDYGDDVPRADEIVARWSGWSLAVRQPTFDGQTNGEPVHRAGMPYDLRMDFQVPPGSLPRLRFGESYRLRARVADIAGGGLELKDPAANRCMTDFVTFLRFEPIGSPDVALPAGVAPETLDPAEATDQVVIRSDGGSVAEFLNQNPGYHSNPRRVMHPPRIALALAEQHAMLDRPADVTDEEWDQRTMEWVRRAMAADESGQEPRLVDPAAGGICIFPRREPGGLSAPLVSRPWTERWPDYRAKQLELGERESGASNAAGAIQWVQDPDVGDLLQVRLAPAEQVTLEVSAFMRANFLDQFAINDPLPREFVSVVNTGRHPMVTPARTVTLVHAVRRPLNEPRGSLDVKREEKQTFAVLEPRPLRLNLDTNSTAKLELSASWSEPDDDAMRTFTGARVQTVVVGRGDEQLRDTLRHEFGDTRHRRVTYTLTAVSRFRQFFLEDEDDTRFVAATPLAEVSIPNSARPAPPVVLSTRPAFVWETERDESTRTVRRRRLGGRLRVELAGPWFQTGEGEQLGVVVSNDVNPPVDLQAFVSQAGRDPIWNTTLFNRWLTAALFEGRSGDVVERPLAELGRDVVTVPYAPWFEDGRWYADIALPEVAASSYCPMVQLALTRYQPESLPGLELSPVVKTEFAPVFPDRLLTVQRSGASLSVKLGGTGPAGPQANRVDVILEQVQAPLFATEQMDFSVLEKATDEGTGTSLIPPPNNNDKLPTWQAVASQVRQGGLGEELRVELPPGTGAFRVRVREVELVGSDNAPAAPQTGTTGELAERVVFADVVAVLGA